MKIYALNPSACLVGEIYEFKNSYNETYIAKVFSLHSNNSCNSKHFWSYRDNKIINRGNYTTFDDLLYKARSADPIECEIVNTFYNKLENKETLPEKPIGRAQYEMAQLEPGAIYRFNRRSSSNSWYIGRVKKHNDKLKRIETLGYFDQDMGNCVTEGDFSYLLYSAEECSDEELTKYKLEEKKRGLSMPNLDFLADATIEGHLIKEFPTSGWCKDAKQELAHFLGDRFDQSVITKGRKGFAWNETSYWAIASESGKPQWKFKDLAHFITENYSMAFDEAVRGGKPRDIFLGDELGGVDSTGFNPWVNTGNDVHNYIVGTDLYKNGDGSSMGNSTFDRKALEGRLEELDKEKYLPNGMKRRKIKFNEPIKMLSSPKKMVNGLPTIELEKVKKRVNK
jgi:hypothetical protein